MQGVAAAESAFQNALPYAKDRLAMRALARWVNGSRLGGSHVATLDFLKTTGAALLDVLDAADAAKRNNIIRVLPEFVHACRAHRLLADKGCALKLVLWLRVAGGVIPRRASGPRRSCGTPTRGDASTGSGTPKTNKTHPGRRPRPLGRSLL